MGVRNRFPLSPLIFWELHTSDPVMPPLFSTKYKSSHLPGVQLHHVFSFFPFWEAMPVCLLIGLQPNLFFLPLFAPAPLPARSSFPARVQKAFHGCCWQTFYIFAYCGLVGNPHLTAKHLNFCSPSNVNHVSGLDLFRCFRFIRVMASPSHP